MVRGELEGRFVGLVVPPDRVVHTRRGGGTGGGRVRNERPVVGRVWMPGRPAVDDRIDGGAQREELRVRGSAGVQQEGPGGSEEQEHERRLVVDRLVLAKDVGVLVA